jgi:ATP-dependent exoDNAse (exonuclease V) alpha subunit
MDQWTIFVKFDDQKIGKQAKAKSKYKDLVPIKAITAGFSISDKSSSLQVERTQYPGTLAWGITVHKSQGSTFEQMIGDMTTPAGKTNTMPGQIYTMLSRAKSMTGLKLCAFDPKKIKVNETALQEMERLTKSSLLQPVTLHSVLQSPGDSSKYSLFKRTL